MRDVAVEQGSRSLFVLSLFSLANFASPFVSKGNLMVSYSQSHPDYPELDYDPVWELDTAYYMKER
jgi:hypothetical protein